MTTMSNHNNNNNHNKYDHNKQQRLQYKFDRDNSLFASDMAPIKKKQFMKKLQLDDYKNNNYNNNNDNELILSEDEEVIILYNQHTVFPSSNVQSSMAVQFHVEDCPLLTYVSGQFRFNLHVYYDELNFPPHNNNIHDNGNEFIHMIEKEYYAKVFALYLISLLYYDIIIQNVDIIWLRQNPLT